MRTVYEIDGDGVWTGEVRVLNPNEGRPASWISTAPPEMDAGKFAVWVGGDWVIASEKPEPFKAASPSDVEVAAYRKQALDTAMAYGNAITQGEMSVWAGVEPLSWTQQRDEAKIVREGGTLDEDAILPGLAADKGITLEAYADDVWANAMRYQSVLRAAVYLRRTATNTLTDESLDTPEKIAEAVAALTVEADALAAQLLGTPA